MKSITIKQESCWDLISKKSSEKGFTITFDEDDEATIFDLSVDFGSKLIPKKGLIEFWDKLMKINFQKVLLENETYKGCDGSNSIVEISVGDHSLVLSLYHPDVKFYTENNCTESLKLLSVVNELIAFVQLHNVALGFKFN